MSLGEFGSESKKIFSQKNTTLNLPGPSRVRVSAGTVTSRLFVAAAPGLRTVAHRRLAYHEILIAVSKLTAGPLTQGSWLP